MRKLRLYYLNRNIQHQWITSLALLSILPSNGKIYHCRSIHTSRSTRLFQTQFQYQNRHDSHEFVRIQYLEPLSPNILYRDKRPIYGICLRKSALYLLLKYTRVGHPSL